MHKLLNKSILVTGGAGFIGANLVEALVEIGAKVSVLDNLSSGKVDNLKKVKSQITFIQGDILDVQLLTQIMPNIEYICHLAAIPSVQTSIDDPLASHNTNATGTLNVLLTAAKSQNIKRVVYSATAAVYGDNPILPKTENLIAEPLSPYAISKYTGELYCQIFPSLYNLETISLRYFNVFGPKQNPKSQYASVIPNFIMAFLNKQSPTIYGDGNQTRDFCFIADVIQANLLALTKPKTNGEIINIACQKRTSLNELVAILNAHFELNIQPIYQPARLGDVRDSVADISFAKKILGYKPVISLKQGLAETIEWYQNLALPAPTT